MIINNNDSCVIEVTTNYQGFKSVLTIDISEHANEKFYLEIIRSYIDATKNIIDKTKTQL